jgi:hypothetical protein
VMDRDAALAGIAIIGAAIAFGVLLGILLT